MCHKSTCVVVSPSFNVWRGKERRGCGSVGDPPGRIKFAFGESKYLRGRNLVSTCTDSYYRTCNQQFQKYLYPAYGVRVLTELFKLIIR